MADKDYKSIADQIQILQDRGLSIPDAKIAGDFLARNNYYRVSGYSLTLRKHDIFSPHATFQNIIDIYTFDHQLRHILLCYLEIIEVTLKSIYSHAFTARYGATGHLDETHFTDANEHTRIIAKIEQQCEQRHRHEAYIKHFLDNLQQDLPLWAYVDLFTISDISLLYKITDPSVKKTVAKQMGLQMSNGPELLGRFLHLMTILRNLCAHGSRLYNRLFEQRPRLSKNESQLLRVAEDGTLDNSHLFSYILIMKRLLNKKEFSKLKSSILDLTVQYPFVEMRYYGFPDDWISIL